MSVWPRTALTSKALKVEQVSLSSTRVTSEQYSQMMPSSSTGREVKPVATCLKPILACAGCAEPWTAPGCLGAFAGMAELACAKSALLQHLHREWV